MPSQIVSKPARRYTVESRCPLLEPMVISVDILNVIDAILHPRATLGAEPLMLQVEAPRRGLELLLLVRAEYGDSLGMRFQEFFDFLRGQAPEPSNR